MPLPLLVGFALATLALALGLDASAAVPRAAAWHGGFAAGLMPLILAAMIHFVPVLTRSATAPRVVALLPLAALLAGTLAAAAFARPRLFPHGIQVAAGLALAVVVALLAWLLRRGRRALGAPHPCLAWYAVALVLLAAALAAALVMPYLPSAQPALRLLHLHLNTLGFVGLTAIGTLQVLLPTALRSPDAAASARLRRRLVPTALAVVLIAAGAALGRHLATVGTVLLAGLLVELLLHWRGRFGAALPRRDGAAASLAAATLGLSLVALLGIPHGGGQPSGRAMAMGFLTAFLLPLVTGAASQLLPVWLRPGAQGGWHDGLRTRLGRHAGWRGALFVVAGIAIAAGWNEAAWIAGATLGLFAVQAARALAAGHAAGGP